SMWSIVCFEIDNSVDFIPNFWMHKGVCAWPKKIANVRSYIEKRIDPADKPDAFSFYNARIIYQNIGKCIIMYALIILWIFINVLYNFILAEIDEARLKARRAQETSDLSSQTDNENVIENKNHTSTQQKHYLSSKHSNKPPSPPLFNISCDDFQKLVNRQHIVLKHEVKNIQDRLDIIMSLQEKMNEHLQGCVSADITEDSFDNTITRVDTVTDLNDLEDKLLNDTVFKKKLTSKQMSGVAVNMTVHEWENHKTHECSSVVTVTEHKTGDKEPATVDLNEEMTDLMDR
ncbi:hypothetical protein ACI65C_003985, partial [Semiaphis heraclei]